MDSEAASRIELEDGRVLSKCDQCRQMWAERSERGVVGDPPCDGCRTELMPENRDAAKIYQICKRQVRTWFNGEVDKEIDLDFVALKLPMDLYVAPENHRECFEKVTHTYYYFLSERQKHES